MIFPSVAPEMVGDYGPFDGVIFAGGADVDPTFLAKSPPKARPTYRKQDEFEIELLKQAVKAGKAILGSAGDASDQRRFGRHLYQDLSENPLATIKHSQDAGNFPSHHLTVEPDSRLFDLMGHRPFVNSRHHQGLKKSPQGVKVVASADDGVPKRLNRSPGIKFSPSSGTRKICTSTTPSPSGSLPT